MPTPDEQTAPLTDAQKAQAKQMFSEISVAPVGLGKKIDLPTPAERIAESIEAGQVGRLEQVVADVKKIASDPASIAPFLPYFVTTHQVGVVNERIKICASMHRGAGGAPTSYQIRLTPTEAEPGLRVSPAVVLVGMDILEIPFQDGDPAKVGLNGFTIEALLAVAADRMEKFQAGPFKSPHNAAALSSVQNALRALHVRTRERQTRGVEGQAKA